jgi:hypothetical protein
MVPKLCIDVLLNCMTVGGPLWQAKECCDVKNGAYVSLLVFMERNE